MEPLSGYRAVGGERLQYLQWGRGSKLLLAFHGYGDDASVFTPMMPFFEDKYTILSFNLPYHGGSSWTDGVVLTTAALAAMTDELMKEYKVAKISLLGYSLGGRVALGLIEQLPQYIDKALLLAPDGMRVDRYYHFFTGTKIGKRVFRNMLLRPQPYFRLIELLRRTGLAHPSRTKFAMHFLQSEDTRNFLLRVWPAMSGVAPVPAAARQAIAKHRVPVTIFMGAGDKVIPAAIAKKFVEGLDTVQLLILDKGHRVLDHDTAQQIAASL